MTSPSQEVKPLTCPLCGSHALQVISGDVLCQNGLCGCRISNDEGESYRDTLARWNRRELESRVSPVAADVHGVTWLLIRDGCVLLERCEKKAKKLGVGEWFVPGGKLEAGESASDALRREISEEWPWAKLTHYSALPIVQGSRVGSGPDGVFLMQPYLVTVEGTPDEKTPEGTPLRWTPLTDALTSPVPQVRMMVAASRSSGEDQPSTAQAKRESYCPGCGLLWDWIDRNDGEHGRDYKGDQTAAATEIAMQLERESKGQIEPDRIRTLILSSPTAAAIYNLMRHEHEAEIASLKQQVIDSALRAERLEAGRTALIEGKIWNVVTYEPHYDKGWRHSTQIEQGPSPLYSSADEALDAYRASLSPQPAPEGKP